MRGLNARLMLACARVLDATDAIKSGSRFDRVRDISDTLAGMRVIVIREGEREADALLDQMIDVVTQANGQGYSDAAQGISDPPALFVSEPLLMTHWQDGQYRFARLQEIATCPFCQDGAGNPCHVHDT